MAISKRGGSWQVSVLLPSKKRMRYSFRDEKDAQVWEKEAELAIAKGLAPVPPTKNYVASLHVPGRTLGDLLVLTQQARWASNKTDAMYETGSRVVKDLSGDLPVSEVTFERVTSYVAMLRRGGLSEGTINRRLAALSAMLKVARDMGWVGTIPKIPYGKERKGERRFITKEEEGMILSHLEGRPEWSMVVVAAETGLRISELIGLVWRNVHQNKVTVFGTKNDATRTVPLTERAWKALSGIPRLGQGPFAGMSRSEVSRRFRAAAVAAGVTDGRVVFHSLRHTCASRLVMAGVDMRRVQVWMGHKTIQSTLVYAHLAPSSLQDARALLDAYTETTYPVQDGRDTCDRNGANVPRSSGNTGLRIAGVAK